MEFIELAANPRKFKRAFQRAARRLAEFRRGANQTVPAGIKAKRGK